MYRNYLNIAAAPGWLVECMSSFFEDCIVFYYKDKFKADVSQATIEILKIQKLKELPNNNIL